MAYSADLRNKALNHSGLTKSGQGGGPQAVRMVRNRSARRSITLGNRSLWAGRGNAVPVLLIRYITDNAKHRPNRSNV
ncbi:transposase [Neisseria gonorrhoeae]|uniref:Transposase n=1 Tax=Neisseria gonorrhoeae TaxID=485 RepID=A0A378W321_NEIGO|nr:transposase [Neisseria gonorrhoeae]